jgi:hypothetical protein
MQIETAVFRRIVSEAAELERTAGIKAVCQTLAETNRFGSFGPEILQEIAKDRIDSWKNGNGW